jgi:membrane protein implicated in regulation of membrane protease activity
MMDLFSIWWVWLVLGLALATAEIFLPGSIFVGFAAGAALTAPLAAWTSLSVPQLAVAFAVLSLISWFVMRRIFGFRGAKAKVFDHDIND